MEIKLALKLFWANLDTFGVQSQSMVRIGGVRTRFKSDVISVDNKWLQYAQNFALLTENEHLFKLTKM